MNPTRRATIVTLTTWLAGCGGGGSDVSTPALAGSLQTKSLTAQASGMSYPLSISSPRQRHATDARPSSTCSTASRGS